MVKMKTYVKIEGTSKDKALERLRKIAVAMPKICVFDTALKEELEKGSLGGLGIPGAGGGGQIEDSIDMVMSYFGGESSITRERCATIISKETDLGDYDFIYEWTSKPSTEIVKQLEKDIKTTMDPLKLKYSVKSE